MDSIFRAMFIYFFLMLVIRIAGNRTLNEMTMFDFVLVLILGDSSQQAITSNDYSVTNAVIVISTLIFLDILLSHLKYKFNFLERLIDGSPLMLIKDGEIVKKALDKEQINLPDILESARKQHGIARLEQIKYAVLEKDGAITIIPHAAAK